MSKKKEKAVEAVEEGAQVQTQTQELVCNMADPGVPGCILVAAKKDGKAANIYYDFGDNLTAMVEKFGEEVTFTQARAQMKIKLQAAMRSYLSAERDVMELVTKYKPGVALERIPVDMSKATESYFTNLSAEEQDALIAKLMASKTP